MVLVVLIRDVNINELFHEIVDCLVNFFNQNNQKFTDFEKINNLLPLVLQWREFRG